MVGQHGKLLMWSHDGTMFAFVDRNPSIQPPQPYPWGCDDCFFPDLNVVRTSDARVLATIRLPEFGEHRNYPDSSTWSPDGSQIVWSTPRRLEPLGKLNVWVVHLALLNGRTLKQQILTSGTSIVSDFYWCAK